MTVDIVRQLLGVEKTGASDNEGKMAAAEKAEKAIEEGSPNPQGVQQPEATNGDVTIADHTKVDDTKVEIKAANGDEAMVDAAKADEAKADVAAEVADSAQKLDGGADTDAATGTGDAAKAEVAAEVADSAQKLDGGVQA